jgi:hypothetical protein
LQRPWKEPPSLSMQDLLPTLHMETTAFWRIEWH